MGEFDASCMCTCVACGMWSLCSKNHPILTQGILVELRSSKVRTVRTQRKESDNTSSAEVLVQK